MGGMHYFMILSILKNGSSSHRNMGLREHWHYLVGTERPHISRTPQPPKVFCSSTSPPDFIFAENQAPVWKVIPPWPLCSGQRKQQIASIFITIFQILGWPLPCSQLGLSRHWYLMQPGSRSWTVQNDCFTSMGYGALKSTSASAQSALSALSVFQISS